LIPSGGGTCNNFSEIMFCINNLVIISKVVQLIDSCLNVQ